MNNEKLELALAYAAQGFKVVAVHSVRNGACTCSKRDQCDNIGKHPKWDKELLPNGLKNATDDPDVIRQWWAKWPDANIAIKTGADSGIVALDIDVKSAGFEWLKEMVGKHGELPKTVEAITGSGGRHYLFKYPGWYVKNSNNEISSGVDIRGDEGYILVAPSDHHSGNQYTWMNSPFDTDLAELPGWLADEIRATMTKEVNKAREQKKGRVWKKLLDGPKIHEGGDPKQGIPGRDVFLFKLGAWMRSKGAGFEDIQATLLAVNEKRLVPPLDESTVYKKAVQASKYPLGIPDESSSLLDFPDTDMGNAERLIHRHGVDLRFCIQMDKWLIWNGSYWGKDEHFEINRRAVETLRAFYAEASAALKKVEEEIEGTDLSQLSKIEQERLKDRLNAAKKRVQWARQSEFKSRIEAMVKLAQGIQGVPVSVSDLDTDKYLFNMKNGTFELKAGKFREARREDLITKVAGIEYDPSAKCPRWEQFITEIMNNDEERIAYFQKFAGYSASGDTSEESFQIGYGNGANGKSKLIEIMLHIWGDYAMQASSALFMMKKKEAGSANPELVSVRGKRLVFVSETGEGKSLDEEFVKSATGNDWITTRDLYEKTISFKPEAKFFLATNHKPLIRGTDNGIWRRITLIPFEVTFEKDKQDKKLAEKLQAEASGIFNWIAKGFQMWMEQGLAPSELMSAATADYRKSMDSIGNFLDDCCVIHEEARAGLKDLYQAYKDWCLENGEHVSNKRMFENRLAERGIVKGKTNGTRYWKGIGLVTNYSHLTKGQRDNRDKNIQENIILKNDKVLHYKNFPEKNVLNVPLSPKLSLNKRWEEGEL